ncbi:MAG: HAD family hydrolase [Actinobacteria bacterium]|nr:HAD family hydrolase [Actinomycetota bacterium]
MPDDPVTPLERLRAARGYVFDLDGTLVLGDRNNHGLAPLPGAVEITRWVEEQGLPFAVFTNGTTKTPQVLTRELRSLGFKVPDDAVLTPASSAARVFARRGHRRVLVLGGNGLAGPLHDAGIEVLTPTDSRTEGVDAVIAGWYPEFTLPALEVACQAVWAGARLYSASQSLFFATAGGRAIGTSRAISAMITSLTGVRARLVGKPSLAALRTASSRLAAQTSELVVVGDDPELEVPMAHRGQALAIAVSSGLGGPDAYQHLPPDLQPHLHLTGVDELLSVCRDALA